MLLFWPGNLSYNNKKGIDGYNQQALEFPSSYKCVQHQQLLFFLQKKLKVPNQVAGTFLLHPSSIPVLETTAFFAFDFTEVESDFLFLKIH